MGMFDLFKKKRSSSQPPGQPRTESPKEKKKSNKELATERGEPYVNVLSMEVDLEDLQNGAFELDWNDIFVARLVKAGYMMGPKDTDADIVDRWFTEVCRNVVLETYEQYQAINNSARFTQSKDLGGGRREVS